MATNSDSNASIVEALNHIVTQNRYAALSTIRFIYNYDPKTSIELWLRLYDNKADQMGLDDRMKFIQLPSYLPVHIAQFLLSNPRLDNWNATKRALIETYGIPVAEQKNSCRRKLEALRQDNLPTRQFKALFQSVLAELPSGVSLPMDVLRNTYLHVINPTIADKILVSLDVRSTWEDVAERAIVMEDLFATDPLHSNGRFTVSDNSQGPSPMEIDALRQNNSKGYSNNNGYNNKGSNNNNGYNNNGRPANKFNQWVRPGVPLCGHCGKEGHLSKRCWSVKKGSSSGQDQIHTLQEVQAPVVDVPMTVAYPNPYAGATFSPSNWVSSYLASENSGVNYSSIPSANDPLAINIDSSDSKIPAERINSLSFFADSIAKPQGPVFPCQVGNLSSTCLVDTGATISAIRSELVAALRFQIDTTDKCDMVHDN